MYVCYVCACVCARTHRPVVSAFAIVSFVSHVMTVTTTNFTTVTTTPRPSYALALRRFAIKYLALTLIGGPRWPRRMRLEQEELRAASR